MNLTTVRENLAQSLFSCNRGLTCVTCLHTNKNI